MKIEEGMNGAAEKSLEAQLQNRLAGQTVLMPRYASLRASPGGSLDGSEKH
jgi:hypothetical protein